MLILWGHFERPPFVSLSKKSEVSINYEVDDIITSRAIETLTEPINTHFSGKHSVEHEILKFSQVGIGKKVFCVIHTTRTLCTTPLCITYQISVKRL